MYKILKQLSFNTVTYKSVKFFNIPRGEEWDLLSRDFKEAIIFEDLKRLWYGRGMTSGVNAATIIHLLHNVKVVLCVLIFHTRTARYSLVIRASARGAGGVGSIPDLVTPK